MPNRMSPPERAKLHSAYHALTMIEDGMRVGLGTGSTAAWLVMLLGAKVHSEHMNIRCVATSSVTQTLARKWGVPVGDLDDVGPLDLTIDGADEFDPQLDMIKGGGGALLQEKIVATSSDKVVIITDPSKRVETLGAFPLPVEIVRFGAATTRDTIEDLLEDHDVVGETSSWRMKDNAQFVTDEGHFLLDLQLQEIGDAPALATALNALPGVVETGLFIDIADTVIIGAASGEARLIFAEDDEQMVDIHDSEAFETLIAYLDQNGAFE